MSMKDSESGDIVTTRHEHYYEKGTTVEIYSLSGEKRGAYKVGDVPSSTTLTLRNMRWYETLWYSVVEWWRRLKRKLKR